MTFQMSVPTDRTNREHTNCFLYNQEVLGRVLGPARGEGNEMAQWILKAKGDIVPRRSHRPLQVAKINSPTKAKKRKWFDSLIERRWADFLARDVRVLDEARENYQLNGLYLRKSNIKVIS